MAECKSKWASLRNSFASALREEKSKKSGSATSKKKSGIYSMKCHFYQIS